MSRLLTLLTLVLLSLFLVSCLPEETVTDARDVDGFSNALSLEFSQEEFRKLSQDLDINRNIELSTVAVPRHIGRATGLEVIEETSSDARKALLGRVLFTIPACRLREKPVVLPATSKTRPSPTM